MHSTDGITIQNPHFEPTARGANRQVACANRLQLSWLWPGCACS